MNEQRYLDLAKEIASYKKAGRYADCISAMARYEATETDPRIRNILLAAKASCAHELGDVELARQAFSYIAQDILTSAELLYVDLLHARLLLEEGHLTDADRIVTAVLSTDGINLDENSDELYVALATKAFVLAHMNEFEDAISFLDRASLILPEDDLKESIFLYRGYCQQALGRLDEAEVSLKRALNECSGKNRSDTFYRLGAVYLQKGETDAAIEAFYKSAQSLTRGRMTMCDIFMGLSQAYRDKGDIELAEQYLLMARKESVVQ
jgi:tetratricopeptide (TPR) repeat protein